MPDKERVPDILPCGCSGQQKEYALKRMPQSWSCLAKYILPAQRRVEVDVTFLKCNEQRRQCRQMKRETRQACRALRHESKNARRVAREAERMVKDADR